MLRQDANGVGRLERRFADDALVHDGSERIHVASPIEILSVNLLGRHVIRGADDGTGAGHLCFYGTCEKLRETEVQYLGRLAVAALRNHDVLGFEVPVHDACRVRVFDGSRDLGAQVRDASERHRSILVEDFRQVVAVDVLHHEVERPGLGAPKVEHMNGVGMIEARRGLRLAMKPSDVLGILLQLRVQQLDRHHLADLHVLGAIDHPHRPTPYRRHHPIPVGDDVARLEHLGDHRRAALPAEFRLRRVTLPTLVAAHLVVWRRARHSTSEVGSRAKLPRER